MTPEEAQERIIRYAEKELAEKDQFVAANYLEDDNVYIFTSMNNCINNMEKCKTWKIYKEDGRIEEVQSLEEIRKNRQKYKRGLLDYR